MKKFYLKNHSCHSELDSESRTPGFRVKPGMTIVFLIFLFVILANAGIHPVNAAGYGLSLYPPLLRVHIKPGKTITQVFKIDNLIGEEKIFIARLVPFTDADLFGNPILNLKSTAPWLSYFSLTNSSIKLGEPFTIKANSSEQLILSLTVPENAALKDLYVTLLVSTYSNTGVPNYQGTQVSATTGSNLLITIASEAYPPTLLRVENITPTSGWLFKFGSYYLADSISPVSFTAQVLNRGDFAAETKGIFKVAGQKAEPIYLEGVLPVNVLAKTKRVLQNNHGENFVFTPNLGHIGPFRATISIKTDNANAENSITIIFLPLKVSFGLFFASLFLIAIYQTTKSKKDTLDTS